MKYRADVVQFDTLARSRYNWEKRDTQIWLLLIS